MAKKPKLVRRAAPKNNELTLADVQRFTFKAWFVSKLGIDKRLKPHHFDQIRIFMKGRGLSEFESWAAYEHGLNAYFGN